MIGVGLMRLALAQINLTVGDLLGNQAKIIESIAQARLKEADVVVFPEMAVAGYPPEDLLYKEHFIRDNLRALQKIIAQTQNITAIVGFVDHDKNKNLYNAAAVISNGQLKDVVHKRDLPNYGVFDEKRYFVAGKSAGLYNINGHSVGISICEDIWKGDGLSVAQAKAGAKILINISSSPYYEGKIRVREKMLKARACETKAFIAYVNLVGGQDELVFDSGSFVFNPKGKILARAKQFEEELLVCDVKLPANKISKKFIKVSAPKLVHKKIKIENVLAPLLEPVAEVYQALVVGTRDYVQKNGFKKVLIGLSGGIDSSLVAAIACDALGRENVVGVTMPSRYSSQETLADAKILAKNLGIRCIEVPIEDILKSYFGTLSKEFAGLAPNIAEENIQARIRGNILMAFSNKFGWLVLTTGNKSEMAVGYCTLYGDMAGGFAVIKDVPKIKVYELCSYRNKKAGRLLIPQSVFDRAPTAELRENQKDEDSLPPYKELDPILQSYVEKREDLSKILKHYKNCEWVKDTIRRVNSSEYKRRQAPPGVKISARAFGKDWRLPITNKYKEFYSASP